MRRESAEVSAAARRRLELLGEELGRPLSPEVPVVPVVPAPGRHAQNSAWLSGLRDRFALTSAHLGVVAVLVAAGLAWVAWSTLHAAPREVAVPPAAEASPLLVAATPTALTPTTPSAGKVVIDIAGKVRRPGVATLPAGSRVVDALRHAGGARRGVDLSTLNLARPLIDGEQILVGVPAAGGPAAGAGAPAPGPGQLLNLNTATLEELEGLPGVGPVTATKILAWRTEHGAFTAVDELLEVDGIGSKTLAELTPHVTL